MNWNEFDVCAVAVLTYFIFGIYQIVKDLLSSS